MIAVRFLTLTDPLQVVKTETFPFTAQALAAVKAYVLPHGYTHVKAKVDNVADDNPDHVRFIATTPEGAMRNVAFGTFDDSTLDT